MSIGGGLWLLVSMLSSPFDVLHDSSSRNQVGSAFVGCFYIPYALVDVTVCIFLRMCLKRDSSVAVDVRPSLHNEWTSSSTYSYRLSGIAVLIVHSLLKSERGPAAFRRGRVMRPVTF
ncbi:hypothetical protein EVAR_36068_1 [Eumeta japonica]|uniref:Uncharacterized protein n=1 Tax=Eumeta variegata TaxID=151549 RepID=A0A4C1ZDQ8_EUMVA|nr:hypothetical protein EVAR_36068_1 [Eumeta japonica]